MTAEAASPVLVTSGWFGAAAWMRAYRVMLRWEIFGSRLLYPILIVSQILVGAGFVIGFGLLIPDLDLATAQYLTTGAVVMSLILVGLVVAPQLIAQQKMEGSYDYVQSLPVPRSAVVAASMTLSSLVAVTGIVAALSAAVWRYDVDLSLDPSIVPAFILTLACGSLLGSAVGHALDNPQATLLFTQLGILFIIGFSPVSFPMERLPGWLSGLHEYLPIHHMAVVVRASLTDGLVDPTFRSWFVLTVWAVMAALVTGLVMGRRR
ncbi:MAG TPA: ABC transporter permease [Acidimicrobiia bacterium]|nr:ABC transporter permease [Acidimicrobiia bacterium]